MENIKLNYNYIDPEVYFYLEMVMFFLILIIELIFLFHYLGFNNNNKNNFKKIKWSEINDYKTFNKYIKTYVWGILLLLIVWAIMLLPFLSGNIGYFPITNLISIILDVFYFPSLFLMVIVCKSTALLLIIYSKYIRFVVWMIREENRENNKWSEIKNAYKLMNKLNIYVNILKMFFYLVCLFIFIYNMFLDAIFYVSFFILLYISYNHYHNDVIYETTFKLLIPIISPLNETNDIVFYKNKTKIQIIINIFFGILIFIINYLVIFTSFWIFIQLVPNFIFSVYNLILGLIMIFIITLGLLIILIKKDVKKFLKI
ncbi:MAG: hypothetical protein ACTSPY_17220 [Candidatus Helarchaeota archaeon]